ncbi:thiamine pyrophosphate-dependent dehydrogenase E1 component subunit alpha [Chloroflexota bacterium]
MSPKADNINPGAATRIPPQTLRSVYTMMLRMRRFEERVAGLITEPSEINCPVHLYTGEEAIAAGVCANLRKDDYVFSTHRSHGHYIAKGGDIKTLMAELFCRTTGCSRGRGGSMHLVSPEMGLPGSTAIVAGSVPLAVGTALASYLQDKDTISAVFFGDGATNEGVWYESLNFSSLKKLPVIFICENNLYSTHMPISACLADTAIYKKADAFGIPGVRIDGNNVFEVYETAKKAIEGARRGEGPTLIECMTYRWRGHVGPNYDLEKGLRSKKDLDYWMNKCPLIALESVLIEQNIMSETEITRIGQEIDKEIEEAITFAGESPYPDPNELLNNVYKS